MASPVRIYAGTQEGLFVWRSKNGSWENVAVSFETGTIDSIDGVDWEKFASIAGSPDGSRQ